MPVQTTTPPTETREVTLTRLLDAPRETVWSLWTDPRHVAKWWGPKGFTNPVCELDMRPGGRIWIVMRGPKGSDFDNDYPMSGTFREIEPPSRLVFMAVAEDKTGKPLLESLTTVTFEAVGAKTRLTVEARAKALSPLAPPMLAGMEAGWTQSLEKLAGLLPV